MFLAGTNSDLHGFTFFREAGSFQSRIVTPRQFEAACAWRAPRGYRTYFLSNSGRYASYSLSFNWSTGTKWKAAE